MIGEFRYYCPDCKKELFDDDFEKCPFCETRIKYCEHCWEYVFGWHYDDDMERCENCINENFTLCRNCHEYVLDEDVNEKRICYVCVDALEYAKKYEEEEKRISMGVYENQIEMEMED